MNLKDERILAMKELMPEVFSEGGIDFEKLRLLLGDAVEDTQERYAFTWPGKRASILQSQIPSTATLRPVLEKSRGRDGECGSFDSDNVYIEGDNLEVLKLMQRAYHGQVKMIYIDPPYNTGHDFVYRDNFGDTIANYKQQAGLGAQSNPETSGRYHSDWCSMMYPRLKLARELLSHDGVIFISIDDNEQRNLKNICDEIFGEPNFIADLIWDLGTGTTAGHFTRGHEYILSYARNKVCLPNFSNFNVGEKIKHGALKKISTKNPAGEIVFPVGFEFEGSNAVFKGVLGDSEKEYILSDEMRFENGKLVAETCIRAGFAMKRQVEDYIAGKEVFDTKGQRVIRFYFNNNGILTYEKEKSIVNPRTVISGLANTKNGSSELNTIFNDKFFDFPKPSELLKFLSSLVTKENDLILDFFSGSATTAHAVMKLNAEDGGNRRHIMVQLPEVCDEKSEAHKAGFKTICEIGEERIRRAGDKIKAEIEAENAQLTLDGAQKTLPDIGFRVFKLDDSGIELPKDGTLLEQVIKPDRSEFDIIFECALKMGLNLTVSVKQETLAGYDVYVLGKNELVCCMKAGLTDDVLEEIAKLQAKWVLILDSILTDTLKLNAIQIFKHQEQLSNIEIDLRTVQHE